MIVQVFTADPMGWGFVFLFDLQVPQEQQEKEDAVSDSNEEDAVISSEEKVLYKCASIYQSDRLKK